MHFSKAECKLMITLKRYHIECKALIQASESIIDSKRNQSRLESKMWRFLCALSVLLISVRTFNYLEFQRRHCYLDTNVRTTAYYFPYETSNMEILDGYVCSNFILTISDLDTMTSKNFSFSDQRFVFLKSCEIEYFISYLISFDFKVS